MEFKDYYNILGVEPSADEKTIKNAYRKLARQFHPDVSKDSHAEEKFKEVTEAYEVLKSKDKRAEYDQIRQYAGNGRFQPPPDWQNSRASYNDNTTFHGDFSEFFNSIFGGQSGFDFSDFSARENRARKGDDIEAELALLLEDTLSADRKTIHYQMPQTDTNGNRRYIQKTLAVSVPKGISDGERIRLKGQGAPGFNGGPAGDLYLRIRLVPHPYFETHGQDLHLTAPIAPWEAVLGGKIKIPTLEGKIQLSIPKNSQSGQKLRIKGKGLSKRSGRGDLIVQLNVVVPPASNDHQNEQWQAVASSYNFDPRTDWQ